MKIFGRIVTGKRVAVSALALSLSVIITAIVVFSRLSSFTGEEKPFIALTPTNCKVTNETLSPDPVTESDSSSDENDINNTNNIFSYARANNSAGQNTTYKTAPRPSFEAVDENNVVWQTETPVEIFKVAYENEQGDITVDGVDDKVFAPGTTNTYNFTFKNTGNIALDYTMVTEAHVSHKDIEMPVKVRLKGYNGNYLTGSDKAFADVDTLNNIKDVATLEAGKNADYALEWEWPFEGDDEFDTMLGNLAVGEDITLKIVIKTTAEANFDPFYNDGTADTGDSGIAMYWILGAVAIVLAAAAVVILFVKSKESETEDESEGTQNS